MTNVPLQFEAWFNPIHLTRWKIYCEKLTTNSGNWCQRSPCSLAMRAERSVIYFHVNVQSNLVWGYGV